MQKQFEWKEEGTRHGRRHGNKSLNDASWVAGRGGRTWVVQKHDQIKRSVAVLSPEVDIGPLAQQVLHYVLVTVRERETER